MEYLHVNNTKPDIIGKNEKLEITLNRLIKKCKNIHVNIEKEDLLRLKKEPFKYNMEQISNIVEKGCNLSCLHFNIKDFVNPLKLLFQDYNDITSENIFTLYNNKLITIKKAEKIHKYFNISVNEKIIRKYAVNICFGENSTILHKSTIEKKLKKYLKENIFDININFNSLLKNNDLIKVKHNGMIMYSTNELIDLENNIKKELILYNSNKNIIPINYTRDTNLTESQNKAVKSTIRSKISILTGGPGVGKTHTCKSIIKNACHNNINIYACALAGTASKQLATSFSNNDYIITGTIAKKLIHNKKLKEFYNENNEYYIIILDEFSMVDMKTFYNILLLIKHKFGYSYTKLILIGDPNQLPSIGHGNLLYDLIKSKLFNHNELSKIHRTTDLDIIYTLELIKNKTFNLNTIKKINTNRNINIHYKKNWNSKELIQKVKDICGKINFNYFENDMIIVTQNGDPNTRENFSNNDDIKKWIGSVNHINIKMQNLRNPITNQNIVIKSNESNKLYINEYRVNDRIIANTNMYIADDDGNETPIYKGSLGYIYSYNYTNEEVIIKFDNNIFQTIHVESLYSPLYKKAYCMTTHLSQGSTFRNIICILLDSHYTFKRNGCKISYTAISRAKEKVHIITTFNSLRIDAFNKKCLFNNYSYIHTNIFK